MKLLAVDTATEHCSVALLHGGQCVERDLGVSRTASDRLFDSIDALLAEAGLALTRLDALAFGRGPGAFTGVRLAASITQGLAYAARLPVLPVSNLRAVAERALIEAHGLDRVLVCQDARMGELYWGCFERRQGHAEPSGSEAIGDVDQPALPEAWVPASMAVVGSGLAAHPELAQRWRKQGATLLENCAPRARDIAALAAADGLGRAVAPELALPVYLRDDVAVVSQS